MTLDSLPSSATPEILSGAVDDAPHARHRVTVRSFLLGLLLAGGLAWLNAWIENALNVHFLSGVQMPFGAIFSLLVLVLFVNVPLKALQRGVPVFGRVLPPLAPAELLMVYVMLLFASLVSTPGCDNFFLTTGAALFYFTTRENRWADMFYSNVPHHFVPNWDGGRLKSEVIDPLYLGGLSFNQVPWHAWVVMLVSWGILLAFVYSTLFFLSLALRRQWIESEALAFPLVQLPLQMVDSSPGSAPPAKTFWMDRTMWAGIILAAGFHMLRGLNNYYPDWPIINAFQGNPFPLEFTENPWNAVGRNNVEFFFGAIGIAYLLTREVSFSFWVFFLLFKLELVVATMLGYPAASMPKDTYLGRPLFVTWQSVGGWLMMGGLLLWTARHHFSDLTRAAVRGEKMADEPLQPRAILAGLVISAAGLLGWCLFSGINPIVAILFFALYGLTSIVLARLVVEGGLLFPQTTFAPLETITGSIMGASSIGAAGLTRLSFLQPMLFADMRTNLLPGFLHTLKIAHELKMDRTNTRRLLGGTVAAILVAFVVSSAVTIATLYNKGGLSTYTWYTVSGPQAVFNGAAGMMKNQAQPDVTNWGWLAVGAAIVFTLVMARARFLWFPLHPLAYIVASSFPIGRLWPSFLIGWLVKSILLRFGGQDWANRVKPFMIGLILGNAAAMVLWMLIGFYLGTQITFWPA